MYVTLNCAASPQVVVDMCFVFQAEDGIRDLVRSRGLGDVYKRQVRIGGVDHEFATIRGVVEDVVDIVLNLKQVRIKPCLLYTS